MLAINEALANAAEFAYLLTDDHAGTMDIQAATIPQSRSSRSLISDRGTWRVSTDDPVPGPVAAESR